eukprot:CAMPEP_0205799742 /NCGR_PEP_ID=MMETSP0205-20121125/1146_1 /ASSEMBLY_ACC=CAM_ASM_000278 /TAXON_ID=36767 /ORGANISM="Euplotes focardii, Strain TN1" /LENGTH=263 /DNA_ID=CAMNT_0053061625 /DNA_START=720 /DNA_END=1508 /DNA_ORIENTATION=-
MANILSQGGTQNCINEEIFKQTGDVLELQLIKTSIMYDINVEHFGWNRNSDEGLLQYIKRVWSDDYLEQIDNNAFSDMNFDKGMKINDLCKPLGDTYYFSYTTGINEKVGNKRSQPELNNEIKSFTNDVIGFDIKEFDRLSWQDLPKEPESPTLYDRSLTLLKECSDPIFTYFRYWIHRHDYDLPEMFEKQKDDKNWDALKWDHKRWREDNDTLLSRVSQEFPRISSAYNSLSSEEKPWGGKDPEQFNWEDKARLSKFDKGRW